MTAHQPRCIRIKRAYDAPPRANGRRVPVDVAQRRGAREDRVLNWSCCGANWHRVLQKAPASDAIGIPANDTSR
jgi:hypothetical protein